MERTVKTMRVKDGPMTVKLNFIYEPDKRRIVCDYPLSIWNVSEEKLPSIIEKLGSVWRYYKKSVAKGYDVVAFDGEKIDEQLEQWTEELKWVY